MADWAASEQRKGELLAEAIAVHSREVECRNELGGAGRRGKVAGGKPTL
jgi:hypothetical protein